MPDRKPREPVRLIRDMGIFVTRWDLSIGRDDLGVPPTIGQEWYDAIIGFRKDWICAICAMREGIAIEVSAADRERLAAVVADRNSRQKHVWRARIILATGEGCGTAEIMRRAGVSKPCVWRWQERFMREGVAGLLHDKTRKPGLPPLPAALVDGVVALTWRSRRARQPIGPAGRWRQRAASRCARCPAPGSAHPRPPVQDFNLFTQTRRFQQRSVRIFCVRRAVSHGFEPSAR